MTNKSFTREREPHWNLKKRTTTMVQEELKKGTLVVLRKTELRSGKITDEGRGDHYVRSYNVVTS